MIKSTRVCIVGGGPAGMMTGLLLARGGVDVVVLEKHPDFLRDFRGDTVHPSTLEVLDELGLLAEFRSRPHQEVSHISAVVAGQVLPVADFSHLPTNAKYVALMPQWDFLDFLLEAAKKLPNFHFYREAVVQELLFSGDAVVGVRVKTADGLHEIRSKLVIGTDGRHSTVRRLAQLPIKDLGAPIDVFWFRLTRHSDDPEQPLGHFVPGRIMVMLNRGDYWQCGFIINKGGEQALHAAGLPAFQQRLTEIVPWLSDRVSELTSWDPIKLLTVRVDRLTRWARPGLLCIGDAAHAMSPVGGVGINLAIQDAVATANILLQPLLQGDVSTQTLLKVQRRRDLPTRLVQKAQVMIHNRIMKKVLNSDAPFDVPRALRLLGKYPLLQRIPGFMIGLGIRPEHVKGATRPLP